MLLPSFSQNQNSLLVKRQNDNTSPGDWPRKISPLVIYWMKTNVNLITHSDLTWDFGKPPFLLHFGKIFHKKNPQNTQNWENKDPFWIGNDSRIRR